MSLLRCKVHKILDRIDEFSLIKGVFDEHFCGFGSEILVVRLSSALRLRLRERVQQPLILILPKYAKKIEKSVKNLEKNY